MTGAYCITHGKDQDALIEQPWTAINQPNDTLIEQSP